MSPSPPVDATGAPRVPNRIDERRRRFPHLRDLRVVLVVAVPTLREQGVADVV